MAQHAAHRLQHLRHTTQPQDSLLLYQNKTPVGQNLMGVFHFRSHNILYYSDIYKYVYVL